MGALRDRIGAPGVPIWATLFLLVVIGFGLFLGIPALLGSPMMDVHTIGWGGRQTGIGIAAVLALFSRNALAYLMIFVIGIPREISDLLEALDETPSNTAAAAQIGVTIVIGVLCASASARAVRRGAGGFGADAAADAAVA
ncbi:MAG: hypothetical protein AAGD35_06215 [Actinomycetota bacterium]